MNKDQTKFEILLFLHCIITQEKLHEINDLSFRECIYYDKFYRAHSKGLILPHQQIC